MVRPSARGGQCDEVVAVAIGLAEPEPERPVQPVGRFPRGPRRQLDKVEAKPGRHMQETNDEPQTQVLASDRLVDSYFLDEAELARQGGARQEKRHADNDTAAPGHNDVSGSIRQDRVHPLQRERGGTAGHLGQEPGKGSNRVWIGRIDHLDANVAHEPNRCRTPALPHARARDPGGDVGDEHVQACRHRRYR